MMRVSILLLTIGCFDPRLDPCAIEGACPDGTRPGADAHHDDAIPGTDARSTPDAPGTNDATPGTWDGTYTISLTYVSPPTGCVFFPSVVLSGVDSGGEGSAAWYGGGTSTAHLYLLEGLDQVEFGNFTDTNSVTHASWIGTRDVAGTISGNVSGSDSCNYGLELTR